MPLHKLFPIYSIAQFQILLVSYFCHTYDNFGTEEYLQSVPFYMHGYHNALCITFYLKTVNLGSNDNNSPIYGLRK